MNAKDRLERAAIRMLTTLPVRPVKHLLRVTGRREDRALDPQLRLGLLAQRVTGRLSLHGATVAAARAQVRRSCDLYRMRPPIPLAYVEDATVPGADGPLSARIYRAEATSQPGPALLYFHGGGHVTGDLDTHDDVCRLLASRGAVAVIAVAYRLAPEHPFPAAFDDTLAVTRWALSGHAPGVDPARLAIGGDSAGGNLVTAVSVALSQADEPVPAWVLAIYPLVDATLSRPACSRYGRRYALELADAHWFRDAYLGAADRRDLRISPWFAEDVSGLPPTTILTAGYDILADDGIDWARRLAAEGVAVEHVHHPSLVHGFVNIVGVHRPSRAAVEHAADALRRALASPAPPRP